MKLVLISVLFLGIFSCNEKVATQVCEECVRCPEPVVCKSEVEVLQGFKDWVAVGDHSYKCMKKNVEPVTK